MTKGFIKAATLTGLAVLLAMPSIARASENTAVGHLDCTIKGGSGFVFGSTRDLRCVFRPPLSTDGELYEGQITKYGINIGVTGDARLTWVVMARTALPVNKGALMGQYVGVSADASLGVGGGANMLVGTSNANISLQPLSVQEQMGLNAAFTVSEVFLVPYHEDH